MKTHRPARLLSSRRNAFTLIELLVVMAIIALLATLTMGAFTYAQQASARSRTTSTMAAIKTGLEQYKEKFGEYPEVANPEESGPGSLSAYRAGSAMTLYQAITGDGSEQIKMDDSDEAAKGSDGVIDEKEMENSVNNDLPKQVIYSGGVSAGSTGKWMLVDGFTRPFQYEKAAIQGSATTVNPTYDLWSFGNLPTGTPPKYDLNSRNDVSITGTWIKNW